MGIKFEVHPHSKGVGTSIVSTQTRLFRKPKVDEWVCHKIGAIMGGEWVNRETWKSASQEMTSQLNDAAQAHQRLSKMKELQNANK